MMGKHVARYSTKSNPNTIWLVLRGSQLGGVVPAIAW